MILESSSNIIIESNITANSGYGIWLGYWLSNNNSISGNNIAGNSYGIYFYISPDCSISENTIAANSICGIYLYYSSGNRFYHNDFIGNSQQINVEPSGYANVWDDGHPSGGNYWSDYAGIDMWWGPFQNKTGSDGIGDTPYVIDSSNRDNNPLMSPYEYWGNPIPGDINRDVQVDSEDLPQIAVAYGSAQFEPNWNTSCDINGDDKVDVSDLFRLGKNYGATVETIGVYSSERIYSTTTLPPLMMFSMVGVFVGIRRPPKKTKK